MVAELVRETKVLLTGNLKLNNARGLHAKALQPS